MKDNSVEKSFCTTSQAAEMLGVSVGTVQLWVENGLLKAWKTTGGHRRVMRDSVEALLHKHPEHSAGMMPHAMTRRLRILVVEDDESLLRLYQSVLGHWPMAPEVAVANNAITGLLMIGRNAPDLLITDLSMPGLDGIGMLRVLRQSPDVAHTTIVVVTGLDELELRQRGGIPRDIEILPKPVPFDRLLDIARHVVAQRALPSAIA